MAMTNPEGSGRNTVDLSQCLGYQCSARDITNTSLTYHFAFVFCERGTSDATCKGRAGLG